jgi:hypothetical protein
MHLNVEIIYDKNIGEYVENLRVESEILSNKQNFITPFDGIYSEENFFVTWPFDLRPKAFLSVQRPLSDITS